MLLVSSELWRRHITDDVRATITFQAIKTSLHIHYTTTTVHQVERTRKTHIFERDRTLPGVPGTGNHHPAVL
jgi:hypothetical protein